MECKTCKTLLNEGDKFCPICGEPVDNNIVNENKETINSIEEVNAQPIQVPVENTTISAEVRDLSNNDSSDDFYQKKSKSSILIPVIILISIFLISGLVFFITRSPKMVFNNLINKMYNQLSSETVDIKTLSGSFSLQTNINTTDESNDLFQVINDILISTEYELDYVNKTALMKFNTKYDNQELLNTNIYLKDQKAYLLLNDIYDKYISMDVDGLDSIFDSTKYVEDYQTITKEIKNALIKSLKSKYFTKEKENITIDKETVSVTKNSLVLTEKVANDIVNDVVSYLKDKDNFVTSLSNISGMTKKQIITYLDDILSAIKEDNSSTSKDQIMISVYTRGLMNDVVGFEVSVDKDNYLVIIEDEKNIYSIELVIEEQKVAGTVKCTNNNGKDKLELSLIDSTSNTKIGLTLTSNLEYNKNISRVDVSNSIDVYALTEEDMNDIMIKLTEKEGIANLIEAIQNSIPELGYGTDFGDGYYDDDYYGYYDDYNEDF